MRESLSSRLGFILLSAGCAIGLGNVWRFPYVAGQNGGGWFVLIYLIGLALIGLPVLIMEFAAGRGAQRSIARMHEVLTPDRRVWRVHGVAGMLGCVVLMMFYTTVSGWMVLYFIKSTGGAFQGLKPDQFGALFSAMLADPWAQTAAMLGVSFGAAWVCSAGLQRGVERVTKWMMLGLLVLIVTLAVRSLVLAGAEKGLAFYLVPDASRLRAVGVGKVVVEAMNHAFFTLSIGIGSMAIFGSYIGRDHTLTREALCVAGLDTFVAIMAGLIIMPACFAFGLEPGQGPGLVFVTLPNVFASMPGGRFWGSVFFLFMSCAALTTVLAVFENILACLCDYTGWPRRKAAFVLAFVVPVLSMPCILGFNVWGAFHPFGDGSCVLDAEDFLVSNILLPLGGLAFVLYCCHDFGWGWRRFRAEANAGEGVAFPDGIGRLYCAYVLPIVIVAVFLIGILQKFKVIDL